MNALDMLFHLFEGTAVHLNYVAVKITIIFASVFLTAFFVGMGFAEGLFSSILGPVSFYLYYVFAFATINHQLFPIDDQFWYAFIHAGACGFAYWLVYSVLQKKGWRQSLGSAASISLMAVALDFVYRMVLVSISAQGNEELVVRTLSAAYGGELVLSFFIVFSILLAVKKYKQFTIPLAAGIITGIIDKNIFHSIAGIVMVVLTMQIQKQVTQWQETKHTSSAR